MRMLIHDEHLFKNAGLKKGLYSSGSLMPRGLYRLIGLLITWALLASACASVALSKKVSPGIQYERLISDRGEIVHCATIDPALNRLVIHQPHNPKLKTVSHAAQEQGAIIAVNGGFFTKEGNPVGMLKVDGTIISKPTKKRGVFGWNKQGELFFDRLAPLPGGKGFVAEFLKKPWWDEADHIISGAPLMIRDGAILEVTSEGTLESFLIERYARTALCLDKSNHIKLMVVNGGDRTANKYGFSGGMSIQELANFMLEQGCVHALNLDGGYSSSFVLQGAQQNSFSAPFAGERPVGTMIMVHEK